MLRSRPVEGLHEDRVAARLQGAGGGLQTDTGPLEMVQDGGARHEVELPGRDVVAHGVHHHTHDARGELCLSGVIGKDGQQLCRQIRRHLPRPGKEIEAGHDGVDA